MGLNPHLTPPTAKARMPFDLPICVSLDLETTGLSHETDDIIEIGAVKFQGDKVIDTLETFVNPQRPVPSSIERLTGIATKDLEHAPAFAAAAETLRTFAGSYPLVGQNIGFDIQFLWQKGLRLTGTPYDTFDLASIVLPSLGDYSLSSISGQLGIDHDRAHRAMNDALMAMNVFLKCLRALEELPPSVVAEMGRIASRSPDWPLRHVLSDLAVSTAALAAAGEPGLEGVNLEALAARIRGTTTANKKDDSVLLDLAVFQRILSETGPLATSLGSYEARPEQAQMAEAVAQVFNRGGQLIAEAGTGTGKSMAYLLPAALFASQRGEPVVISTNTINLQEQIVQKDIPDALKALADAGAIKSVDDVCYTMLKGRGNYLCLRKWANLKNAASLTPPEARTLIKLLCWLSTTGTGDRGELNLTPPEADVWARLSAQGYDSEAGPCPMMRRGLCFYAAARQRAESAHLVSVNHALLALDAKHGSLLPAYRHLIIDEAHNLEEVATNQFGFEVDDAVFDAHLGTIAGGAGVSGLGILPRFRLAVRGLMGTARSRELAAAADAMEADIQASRSRLSTLFKQLNDLVVRNLRGSKDGDSRLQLVPAVREQPGWAKIVSAWEETNIVLEKVHRGLLHFANQVPGLSEQLGGKNEEYQQEIALAAQFGEQLCHNLASALVQPDEAMVHWLSIGYQDAVVKIHSAPLHVGPVLQERLFSKVDTLVLTGATLSTEGNFEYLKERLSLKPTAEILLGSPFDYKKAALIYVPQDMPDPTAPNYQAALDKIVADVARAAHGRTLVLFTSRAALKNTRNGLKEVMAQEGITVLGQGIDGSPRQLIRTFKSTPNVVLLGAGSFWEGVDIAGDALSVLIIARLPFTVPSDPVFAARSRKFEDPFSHYAVPQAVIRFRQGFGRLIRRKTDRGVLVVLDRRVFSKRYGMAFLDSLPACVRRVGMAKDLPAVTQNWLAQRPLV